MKCLSLWQPHASLVRLKAKGVETRSWGTAYRGPLLIHAAKKFCGAQQVLWYIRPFRGALLKESWPPPLGAIIARCDLVDVRFIGLGFEMPPEPEKSFGNYEFGRYAWYLANVVPFKKPIPYRGFQRLFNVPDHIREE